MAQYDGNDSRQRRARARQLPCGRPDAGGYTVGRQEQDRIYCWPIDDTLLLFMLREGWHEDPALASKLFHGVKLSFREPRFEPSLQVCIHWVRQAADDPLKYFLEIDLDFHNLARDPVGHLGEALGNAFTGSKTDQEKIAIALDARFAKAKLPERTKQCERAIFLESAKLESAKRAERANYTESAEVAERARVPGVNQNN